ncbi:hypothetical protein PRIPAC_85951 [Pristionchus pacificus]|uniref:Uncharacterized protein n=1 Tax=Pristionchus pacificus TaxID=54126 RepID=A0A2A6BKF7_PRIPA|nr:hypothetical protein PRIPAC_85951 [Pristionchus pacificus]|eukprot:PDM66313.1 hypothetical protein PRIPAC_47730 [Pristionchus pacificus]
MEKANIFPWLVKRGSTSNSPSMERYIAFDRVFKENRSSTRSRVAELTNDYAYDLFWNDGETDNVLENAADLATAIDFAIAIRASPAEHPCVLLIVTETKPDCGELEDAVTKGEVSAEVAPCNVADTPVDVPVPQEDLLPRIKEHFHLLLHSALDISCSTQLRRAAAPLICPRTGHLQKPSDVCVADIALQLLRMERRVPGELKDMMQQLPGQDFIHILKDEDWLMELAQECPADKGVDMVSGFEWDTPAVTDVRMAVMMVVDLPLTIAQFQRHYLEEYQCAGGYGTPEEEEEEEEEEEIADDWIGRSSAAIRKRALDLEDAACANRVYPSPYAFLLKAAERASSAEDTTANDAIKKAPMDRVERLREHLAHLPSSIPNILQTTTAYEIHERASSLEYVDWYYHQHEEPEREVSAQAEIDAIIRRTTDNIPVELEHELASMSPQSLAKVVLMDWVDRLREEREAVKNLQMKTEEVSKPTRCPPATLYGLMKAAAAAEVFPEELRRAVEIVIEKQKEDDSKDDEGYKNKLSTEELHQWNQSGIHMGIVSALAEYMTRNNAVAFTSFMVPSSQPHSAPIYRDPAHHIKKLSELVKSLNMETEMQYFMKNPTKLQAEIARILCFYAQSASANRVEGRFFAARKAEKEKEGGGEGDETEEDEDENKTPTKMSSVTLAALIITDALCPYKWQESTEQPHPEEDISEMPVWIGLQASAKNLAPELPQQQQPPIHSSQNHYPIQPNVPTMQFSQQAAHPNQQPVLPSQMTRLLVVFLTFFAISSARVSFEDAEVLERADLTNDKAPFECRSTCRVYTPTSKALRIIDDKGKNVTTFAAVRNQAVGKPLELAGGKYFVVNDEGTPSPEFTLYVVQKGAANYDTLVYPFPQKRVNATNARFVTVLTDQPGLRVVGIDGEFGAANPAVYATGFDSVSKCRPVFQSRSSDNARLTSVVVFGPIATVDFGSDKGTHFVTFDVNYLSKATTQVGSSTVLVSPAAILTLLAVASARVTFDHAEVLDHNDLKPGEKKAAFDCPSTCRVYTPTGKTLKIIDDKGKDVITFVALHSRPIDQPLELSAGKYFVVNDNADSSPDFTLYVVQNDAANYNTRVYTSPQEKADATNERFATILTDAAGLRISDLWGDFGSNPSVYATGFDSVSKCRPVFASRSTDNARLTSVVVFGPIATVDFGSDQGAHFLTIGYDYLSKPTTQLGSSTVLVSPGYVGCPDNQVFTNIQINQVNQPPYTISSAKGVSLKLVADYAIETGFPSVQIKISDQTVMLTGTDSLTKYVDDKSLTVSVNWSRGAGDYLSHFAIQIDNFENNGTPHGPDKIETLQTVNTPHSRAREQTLSDQRAQIFFDALAQQNANNLGPMNNLGNPPNAVQAMRLSVADAERVTRLTNEMETVESVDAPHARALQRALSHERAKILLDAQTAQAQQPHNANN